MRKLVAVVAVGFSVPLMAGTAENTFVGNGGNSGDVEMLMTLRHIEAAASEIEDSDEKDLCVCPEVYGRRPLCAALESLDEKQRLYCAKTLKSGAAYLKKLAGPNRNIQIDWADGSMNVKEAAGLRDADAVANHETRRIVVARKNFVDRKGADRVALMAHELFHLVQIDGKYLSDDKPVGPFTQPDGSRQLLNALGSGVAVAAHDSGIYAVDGRSLTRSKNYAKWWLFADLGRWKGEDDRGFFAVDEYKGANLGLRYQITQEFGVLGRFKVFSGDQKYLTSTEADVTHRALGAGVFYRFMPFEDPLTFLGQSFFYVGAGFEAMRSEYLLKDNFTSLESKSKTSSPFIQVQYLAPFSYGWWVSLGVEVTNHDYEFKEINVKNTKPQTIPSIGVNYAF